MNISYEQLKNLVEMIIDKSPLDYIFSIGSLLTSVALVILSCYIFIKTPKQAARSKIHEKEVDLLYKAFDCFCIFSDIIGLYISNKNRKYNKLSDPFSKPLEKNFTKNEIESSENVYKSFTEQSMASNILHSIGAIDAKKSIDNYKNEVVKLRVLIIDFEESMGPHQLQTFKEISKLIETKRADINKLKDVTLDQINISKNKIMRKI